VNIHLIEDGANPEEATKEARGNRSFEDYADSNKVGTAEEITELLKKREDAGVDYFITYLPRIAYDHSQLEMFAEGVMPNFR
jgi:hypothetical protein